MAEEEPGCIQKEWPLENHTSSFLTKIFSQSNESYITSSSQSLKYFFFLELRIKKKVVDIEETIYCEYKMLPEKKGA